MDRIEDKEVTFSFELLETGGGGAQEGGGRGEPLSHVMCRHLDPAQLVVDAVALPEHRRPHERGVAALLHHLGLTVLSPHGLQAVAAADRCCHGCLLALVSDPDDQAAGGGSAQRITQQVITP